MTPEKHNRNLGLVHLVYAGLIFLMVAGAVISIIWPSSSGMGRRDTFDLLFETVGIGVVALFYLACAIPSLVAAWALFKRKAWAKTAAAVGGATAVMICPLGALVTVYTFWFLSAPAKALYGTSSPALPAATTNWANETDSTRRTAQMPDWR